MKGAADVEDYVSMNCKLKDPTSQVQHAMRTRGLGKEGDEYLHWGYFT